MAIHRTAYGNLKHYLRKKNKVSAFIPALLNAIIYRSEKLPEFHYKLFKKYWQKNQCYGICLMGDLFLPYFRLKKLQCTRLILQS